MLIIDGSTLASHGARDGGGRDGGGSVVVILLFICWFTHFLI